MSTLVLERRFSAPPDRVFAFVTQRDHLATWLGAAPKVIVTAQLNFEQPGPWAATFLTRDEREITVSGQVTHVDPPASVGFTWAWHDDNGQRGADESHVTFALAGADGGGTLFTLTHVRLASTRAVDNHRVGWTVSLDKLQSLAAT